MRHKERLELAWQTQWAPQVGKSLEDIRAYWKLYRRFDEKILPQLAGATKVADVGCGISTVLHFVDAKEKHGFDPLMSEYRSLYDYPKGITVYTKPGENLEGVYDDAYDFVFCSNCLDHVDGPPAVVSEIARILKPGGKLFLSVEIDGHKSDAAHPHLFGRKRVLALVDPHFEVIESWTSPWIGLQRYVNGERSPVATELCLILEKRKKEE